MGCCVAWQNVVVAPDVASFLLCPPGLCLLPHLLEVQGGHGRCRPDAVLLDFEILYCVRLVSLQVGSLAVYIALFVLSGEWAAGPRGAHPLRLQRRTKQQGMDGRARHDLASVGYLTRFRMTK